MLCFRIIFWGIVLIVLMIPFAFLVGIIGRMAGFRPGSKPGATETAFGWFGIVVLGGMMLGICVIAGVMDWCIASVVNQNMPQRLEFRPSPKPIPAAWKEDNMQRTWLSDLQEFNTHVGWGTFGKRGKLGYGIPGGDTIRVDNKFYPNSISMHPPSRSQSTASYRLNRQYKLFKAWAALNDTEGQNPSSTATFVVLGDGVCLWASKPMDRLAVLEPCRISVEAVDVLELQVHCPGHHGNVRAVLLEPALFQ